MHRSEVRQLLKERINIVQLVNRYVTLRQNGTRWVAPCPFHKETKPSFYVDEAGGRYYCFGCQAKGDVINFYAQINGITYQEATNQLALEQGIVIGAGNEKEEEKYREERRHKHALESVCTYAAALFREALQNEPKAGPCREYIARRGLSPDIVNQFGIGYALDTWDALKMRLERDRVSVRHALEAGLLARGKNDRLYDRFRGRLIFPITTFPSQVIAFGGRIIAAVDAPKYINSPETPIYHKGKHLYGLVQAAPGIRNKGYALLTEGYMDVVTLHQFGYTNAVGVLGTALTPDQITTLTARFTSRVVLIFDGDPPGRKAALRACQMILPLGIDCAVVLLPDPEDIDSLLRSPNGKSIFDGLLEKAPQGLDFFVQSLRTLAPRDLVARAHEFLGQVPNPELFSVLAKNLADRLGLSEALLRDHQAHLVADRSGMPAREAQGNSGTPGVYRPPVSRLSVYERQILMFAARHPDQIELLVFEGAERMIRSTAAQSFWLKVKEGRKEDFTPQELSLFESWTGKTAPPLDNEAANALELEALQKLLLRFGEEEQKHILLEGMRNAGNHDFSDDLEYLNAVTETIERRNRSR